MNKYTHFAIIGTLAGVALSLPVHSAELILTGAQGKAARTGGNTSVSIDIVSDGNLRGFDAIIPVPKGAKVDTSKCLAGAPSGFQTRCVFNGTEVVVVAVSPEKKGLPAGIHPIGTIKISGVALPKSLKVEFNAIDAHGKELNSSIHSDL